MKSKLRNKRDENEKSGKHEELMKMGINVKSNEQLM